MNQPLVGKIQEFSHPFDTARRLWDWRQGLIIDYERLDSKPFDAMMFFTMYAHERPFSNPRYPVAHRMAILKVLGAKDVREPGLNDIFRQKYDDPSLPAEVWSEFKAMLIADKEAEVRQKIERYTRGSVQSILEQLGKNQEPSIVALLMSRSPQEAYTFLKSIKGIARKIAALFLRDIQSYCNGWNLREEDDLWLQPVDRWVQELAELCWGKLSKAGNPEVLV